MLELHAHHELGRGKHRVCYRDPKNEQFCIKIPVQHPDSLRQQKREIRWLRELERRRYDFAQVARYVGPVSTNLGLGHRYQLVRDQDGQPSQSIAHYFRNPSLHGRLSDLIDNLYQHILQHRIAFYDLTSPNLLWQRLRRDDGQLVFVDGVGDPSALRFLDRIPSHFTQKVERRFTRACETIAFLRQRGDNPKVT